ncbi:MAG TPA: 30S ribosomal protein S4 [Nevskiaceae bacterium]|nr:30S ribosomal protein S4 [Nevskiaceae bacterium]
MARYKEAKCRLCRREGIKLFLKGERCYSPKCPIERKGAVPPGQHGQKRRRRMSDYGHQLREKQKVKRLYGVLERQFRSYFKKASKTKEGTGKVLLQVLESRIDNVVFRLGFVPSRSTARQLVSHGFVLVDGNKKVNIASQQLNPGQTISLTSGGLNLDYVKKSLAEKERKIPDWLTRKAAVGKMIRLPEREEIETDIDESLIVEYYSR